jgi:hypothetical protein
VSHARESAEEKAALRQCVGAVLLFEVWRPDISADERDYLTRIFAAIDGYDVN